MLFKDKERLLGLYNAVSGKQYTDIDKLTIVTLENAIYMNMKNDVAFVIDMRLSLYEHQSTVNPNMPLRFLQYVTREYEKLTTHENLYGKRLIKVPTPAFVIFYNGSKAMDEKQEIRLSEMYEVPEDMPQLELRVQVLNINSGYNEELKEHCRTLKEYMLYVECVREKLSIMAIDDAVEEAVQECIDRGILKEFLTKNRAEVKSMSLFEYDDEATKRDIAEYEREEGQNMVNRLNILLTEAGRTEDILKAAQDKEYQKRLFEEFGI
jgi:hypothetical protein